MRLSILSVKLEVDIVIYNKEFIVTWIDSKCNSIE